MISGRIAAGIALLSVLFSGSTAPAADKAEKTAPEAEVGQFSFRRTAREYGGRVVEGEDRVIARGDSVWRMLVKEKGVPEKQFSQYLVVIRGLNPQLKNLNALKIGDTIFIPLRPEELLGPQPVAAQKPVAARPPLERGTTRNYRVRAGDHLYQILREQLGIQSERELASHYALVKDLNPEKKNWDVLIEGETIRLPLPPQDRATRGARQEVASAEPRGREARRAEPAPAVRIGPDYAQKARARESTALVMQVAEALGNEVHRGGQETLELGDRTVRLDRSVFPVVYNPELKQKTVLDFDGAVPASLRAKLGDPKIGSPVLAVAPEATLQAAVSQLLSSLGYQALPSDRPVVISDGGVAVEVKGNWVVLAPEQSNKMQQVFVVTLTERPDEIPEYLKSALAQKGLHVRDIVVPGAQAPSADGNRGVAPTVAVRRWPQGKEELVDAVLSAFSIPFKTDEMLTVEMRRGLLVEMKSDRVFEMNGKRVALVFQPVGPEMKKVLLEKHGMAVQELDISTLTRKEIITRLLNEVGEPSAYSEHRFAAANGANQERLRIAAWGFLLSNRGMFLTDREIPRPLHRFFFEKGLEIVYFQ